jgi:hypothetical protein
MERTDHELLKLVLWSLEHEQGLENEYKGHTKGWSAKDHRQALWGAIEVLREVITVNADEVAA